MTNKHTPKKNKNQKSSVVPERKAGRPTEFKDDYIEQAYKLCRLGAIDRELANFFGVSEQTLNTWKKKHPAFLESIKSAKADEDALVEKSLYKRANGYEYEEVDEIYEGERLVKKIVKRKYAHPDTGANAFWLKNRKPEVWRDKREIETKNEHDIKKGGNLDDIMAEINESIANNFSD